MSKKGVSKGFDGGSWNGVVMPAGPPPDILNRIHAPLAAELKSSTAKETLLKNGALASGGTPLSSLNTSVKRPQSGPRSQSSRTFSSTDLSQVEPPAPRRRSMKDDRQIQQRIELVQKIVDVLG